MSKDFIMLDTYGKAKSYARKFFKAGLAFEIVPYGQYTNRNHPYRVTPIFHFREKVGVNYIFTHTTGGWTRCYTAAQLMGNKIREVSSDDE